MDYTTVYGYSSDSFIEKRSEFIGHISPVSNEEEAAWFINKIKAQNRRARHNVYAYILREGNVSRYSDDGEPQGTGGVPVLEVLRKSGLTDVCVVVTRYFGGILLGGGGLVRAYSHACKLAVDSARKMLMCRCSRITFSCDYSLYGRLTYIFPSFEVRTESENFSDEVTISLLVRSELVGAFKKKLADLSNGKIELCEVTDLWEDFS